MVYIVHKSNVDLQPYWLVDWILNLIGWFVISRWANQGIRVTTLEIDLIHRILYADRIHNILNT